MNIGNLLLGVTSSAADDDGFGPVPFIIGIIALLCLVGVQRWWVRRRDRRMKEAAKIEIARREREWRFK